MSTTLKYAAVAGVGLFVGWLLCERTQDAPTADKRDEGATPEAPPTEGGLVADAGTIFAAFTRPVTAQAAAGGGGGCCGGPS